MLHLHSGLEFSGTDTDERDAIPMLRVHVRLNLEHEPRERRVRRLNGPDVRLASRRCRSQLEELAQERLDAEVRQRTAEEHGSEPLREHLLLTERVSRLVEKHDVVDELLMRHRA